MGTYDAWSDAEKEIIRRDYDAGLTCSQIALHLENRTRNAVVGWLNRAGLRRRRGMSEKRVVTNGVCHKPRLGVPLAKKAKKRRAPSKPIAPTIMLPELAGFPAPYCEYQSKSLNELQNHHCRWGFNDPSKGDFFFCGAPEADLLKGRPYCEFHMERAFGDDAAVPDGKALWVPEPIETPF